MSYTTHKADQLIAAMYPLLEFWAVADDVFTTEDALSREHVYKTAGRLYRAWSEAKAQLDPDYDPERDRKPRRERSRGARSRANKPRRGKGEPGRPRP